MAGFKALEWDHLRTPAGGNITIGTGTAWGGRTGLFKKENLNIFYKLFVSGSYTIIQIVVYH